MRVLSSIFGKKATACPYCYASLDVNKVAFRCSGRGLPGRTPCVTLSDSRRLEAFGDSTPVMPSIGPVDEAGNRSDPSGGHAVDILAKSSAICQGCGGESGVRMCPACHSLLPRSLDNSSPMFGLVGVRSSGKTVLLSVLHKELIRTVARRFDASIDTPGGSAGFARELANNEENMGRSGGVLPGQTQATGRTKKEPAVYEWKYTRKGKTQSTIFSFYDSAGEDISSQAAAMEQQYLGESSGVILLLDPFAFPENQVAAREKGITTDPHNTPEDALDGITYVLQEKHKVKPNKKIKVPLAVVVSKIDAFFDQVPANHPLRQAQSAENTFDEAESQTIHDHMASLITQWGGDNLLRKLNENYETFRLIGVSALGAEPDYQSGTVSSRGLLPHRVADPILWLLSNSGFIPVKKV